jgi:hypothetical protein
MSLEHLSDEPLAEPKPRTDLVAKARLVAAELRHLSPSDKTALAVYRCPDYIRWTVEALSNAATSGAIEPAAVTVVQAGLSAIRQFPGVGEITAARRTVLPEGEIELLSWLGAFPPVSVYAAGTDDSGEYRLHVPRTLLMELGNMARSIGLSQSRLGLYALAAGVLQVPQFSKPQYRKAMVQALRDLRAVLQRRGREAQARAEALQAADRMDDGTYTIADVIGSEHTDDNADK